MTKKHDKHHEEPKTEDVEVTAEEHEAPNHQEAETPEPKHDDTPPKNPWVHLYRWALANKKISIPVSVALLVLLLAAVPFTRYAFAGLLVKQSFPVIVVDSETGKPVSSASLSLNGQKAETDGEGRASVRTKVGYGKLTVTKKYYQSHSQRVLVTFQKQEDPVTVKIKADGRPVPVTVLNYISKKPIAGAVIAAEGTEAKTDDDGKAVIVVPEGKKDVEVKLSGQGFNSLTAKLTVTIEEVEANTFSLSPSGKIYFMSNASGKIDLVKSNLDGTDRQTVLPGTGKEDRYNTVLLASRDWKYIALLSKRDGGQRPKLFLIETETDKLTTMDEGDANFTIYGWIGDRFVYKVERNKEAWESKRESIKSYSVSAKKITTLVDTVAENAGAGNSDFVYNHIDNAFIIDQDIIYSKNWSWAGFYWGRQKLNEKKTTLESIRADGSQLKTIKSYPPDVSIYLNPGHFGELYIRYYQDGKDKYDEYKDGKVTNLPNYSEDDEYRVYSVSPSGGKTLWSENRDGKNVFFVGDNKGENGKEIGRTDEYAVYGWFTDDYILLTKKGSEMYILPADGLKDGIEKAGKISDYYKPNYSNRGFGYGYGG